MVTFTTGATTPGRPYGWRGMIEHHHAMKMMGYDDFPERAFGTGREAKIRAVAFASPVSQPRSGVREKGVSRMRAKSH